MGLALFVMAIVPWGITFANAYFIRSRLRAVSPERADEAGWRTTIHLQASRFAFGNEHTKVGDAELSRLVYRYRMSVAVFFGIILLGIFGTIAAGIFGSLFHTLQH